MTAAEWAVLKSLFLRGVAMSPSERQEFLTNLEANQSMIPILGELFDQSESSAPRLDHPCWLSPPSSLPSPRAFQIGERLLDRFEVIGFLGAGGIGEVYRAFDHNQSVFVALKTLRTILTLDATASASLRNELNIARSITHPNICRLYDFHWPADPGGRPFFTMELIEGETLAERLRRRGPFAVESARPLVSQLADAMKAAHDRGVVHRDLKTGNVMLCAGTNRLVVMDFGLARESASETSGHSAPPTTQFAGTPAYMAPEQLRGKRATFTSDIHSFGVVLFEMMTGRRPFEGATTVEIASRRLNEEAPSPRRFSPDLNRGWELVIMKCLASKAADRPQSFDEIRLLLEKSPPILASRRSLITASTLFALPALGVGTYWFMRSPGTSVLTVAMFNVENRSGDPKLDYVCQGTSTELLRRLSQLPGVSVLPMRVVSGRNRANTSATLALAGVLQLENGAPTFHFMMDTEKTGETVWSEAFPLNKVRNMVTVQDDIAARVTAKLKEHASLAEVSRLAFFHPARSGTSPTTNSVALDYYMRASQLLQEQSAESVHVAIGYLERAVNEDPRFALAYASLGEAYLALKNFDRASGPAPERARDYAQRAIQEDPELAEAHAVLAAVHQLEWDWAASEASYNEALRLKPAFARAYRWRGGLRLQFARFKEALDDNEMSWRLDPYDRSAIAGHGLCLLFSGKTREAADFLSKEIADRDLLPARYNLAQAYARLGQFSQGAEAQQYYTRALEEARRAAQIEQRSPTYKSYLSTQMFALTWAVQGKPQEAEPYLRHLESFVDEENMSPGFLAMIYSPLKRIADALSVIERAVALHDRFVFYLRTNVFLENLWGEPRFEALLHSVHLK
jgi:serine/threonine protein kinase/tetratricopeptide (TPR) repeat protein